jgi:hypothetical protein
MANRRIDWDSMALLGVCKAHEVHDRASFVSDRNIQCATGRVVTVYYKGKENLVYTVCDHTYYS